MNDDDFMEVFLLFDLWTMIKMMIMMAMIIMVMTATQPGARERAGQEEATRKCGSVSAAPAGRYIGQLAIYI